MSPPPTTSARPTAPPPPSIRLPGIILGVGLGGFVDGILLHQILQWHHMLTSTNTDRVGIAYYPADTVHGLRMNTIWDGLFHTFTWLCVLVGLAVLYSRVEHSRGRVWTSRALWGLVLFGWGLFNVAEGLVDHQILGIHHVRSGPHEAWWDMGFLALGVLLMAAGWLVQRGATFHDHSGPTASSEPGPVS
jgi:uncharacterized membrane protein